MRKKWWKKQCWRKAQMTVILYKMKLLPDSNTKMYTYHVKVIEMCISLSGLWPGGLDGGYLDNGDCAEKKSNRHLKINTWWTENLKCRVLMEFSEPFLTYWMWVLYDMELILISLSHILNVECLDGVFLSLSHILNVQFSWSFPALCQIVIEMCSSPGGPFLTYWMWFSWRSRHILNGDWVLMGFPIPFSHIKW